MRIMNIDGLSASHLQEEVNSGARFVFYSCTISAIIFTFRRTSGVYLLRRGEKTRAIGSLLSMITVLLGWWGIPFGPKYTLEALRTNLQGGKDVTDDVMAVVAGYALFEESQKVQ